MFRLELAPPVAEVVRHLPPEVKRAVKEALRAISANPGLGIPLVGELGGLRRYRVRRFRIIYSIDRSHRVIRILAIGHRRDVYEEVTGRSSAGAANRAGAKLRPTRITRGVP